MKKCVTCGEVQAEEAFNFRNKRRGIRWGTCKTCQSKQRKRWYQKNKKAHIRNVRKHKKKAITVAPGIRLGLFVDAPLRGLWGKRPRRTGVRSCARTEANVRLQHDKRRVFAFGY